MENTDMAKELWSLGNVIAGFSVAQSLVFAFALGKDLAGLQSHTRIVKIVLTVFCVAFGIIYSFAVFRCYGLAMLVDRAHEAI